MWAFAPVVAVLIFFTTGPAQAQTKAHAQAKEKGGFFLPNADSMKIVTVAATGEAALTEALAVKQNGPPATVKKFGEVYAFSPQFIAVHRDEPTQIEFWNLQPDDEHDVAILDHDLKVLMYQKLPPLKKTSWVFTFHREGLFDFKCLVHQPEMSGQILVLPPLAH
jgi:plastocyanin